MCRYPYVPHNCKASKHHKKRDIFTKIALFFLGNLSEILVVAHSYDLGHDGQSHSFRCFAAEVEANRAMNAANLLGAQILAQQALIAFEASFAAADSADVGDFVVEYYLERGLVEFRIMRQDRDGGGGIEVGLLQIGVRPLDDDFVGVREALTSSEGRARVNDDHAIVEGFGEGGQWNGDMAGANDNQAWRRREAFDEDLVGLRACCALQTVGVGLRRAAPDGTFGVSNDQLLQPVIVQAAARASVGQNKQPGPNVVPALHNCRAGHALFLEQPLFQFFVLCTHDSVPDYEYGCHSDFCKHSHSGGAAPIPFK